MYCKLSLCDKQFPLYKNDISGSVVCAAKVRIVDYGHSAHMQKHEKCALFGSDSHVFDNLVVFLQVHAWIQHAFFVFNRIVVRVVAFSRNQFFFWPAGRHQRTHCFERAGGQGFVSRH